MIVQQQVIEVLGTVLNLGNRTASLAADTPLLGALPELDSMAVVSLLTGLEERFGFAIDDDEVDGTMFATVGTLAQFVERKLTQ
ncbi:MAG TPA: phosphopantetheine-binding protein [Burkholderiaceae bacterium]|nr:phosphopantetheine-binding protein [Burkholderiaceae bacterium]